MFFVREALRAFLGSKLPPASRSWNYDPAIQCTSASKLKSSWREKVIFVWRRDWRGKVDFQCAPKNHSTKTLITLVWLMGYLPSTQFQNRSHWCSVLKLHIRTAGIGCFFCTKAKKHVQDNAQICVCHTLFKWSCRILTRCTFAWKMKVCCSLQATVEEAASNIDTQAYSSVIRSFTHTNACLNWRHVGTIRSIGLLWEILRQESCTSCLTGSFTKGINLFKMSGTNG